MFKLRPGVVERWTRAWRGCGSSDCTRARAAWEGEAPTATCPSRSPAGKWGRSNGACPTHRTPLEPGAGARHAMAPELGQETARRAGRTSSPLESSTKKGACLPRWLSRVAWPRARARPLPHSDPLSRVGGSDVDTRTHARTAIGNEMRATPRDGGRPPPLPRTHYPAFHHPPALHQPKPHHTPTTHLTQPAPSRTRPGMRPSSNPTCPSSSTSGRPGAGPAA